MDPNERTKSEWEENIDDEELRLLVLEAQREALEKAAEERRNPPKPKAPFPRWIFYLIALVLVFNTAGLLFETFSIPAVEFAKTSARLSTQEDIAAYKEAVVTVINDNSRGTGFAISEDGTLLTNYHVIEGSNEVTVNFPEAGRFRAEVVDTYPEIDLAVLQVEEDGLPYLELADQLSADQGELITFIGNPLGFLDIANEGTILEYYQLEDWDQPVMMIQAPVYRGNSGSPVLNEDGKVIGVVFATMKHEEHGKVGLFIPIEYFHQQIE